MKNKRSDDGSRRQAAFLKAKYGYAFCALVCLSALILFIPPVQNMIISFGERLKGRELNHLHWQRTLWTAGTLAIIFAAASCALLLCLRHFGGIKQTVSAINGRKSGSVRTAVFFFILTLLVATINITDGHDWGDDFGEYIKQGISIANGTYTTEYVNTSGYFIYPHGFPLLLAAVYKLTGFSLLAFKAINAVMYAVFAAALFYYCDKKLKRVTAMVIAALFSFSPCLYKLTDCILSDTSSLTFTFIALMFMSFFFEEADGRKRFLLSLGTGFFSACSYICRDSGVVLICTFFCVQLLRFAGKLRRKDWKDSGFSAIACGLIPYAVFFVLTFLINSVLFPSPDRKQLDLFKYLSPSSIISNCVYYFTLFSDFFYPGFIWFVLFTSIFWAMAKSLHRDYVFIVYFLGIMALYIIWPIGGQGIRYVVSAIPILLFFAGRAAETLHESATSRPLFAFGFRAYVTIAVFSCLIFMSISVATGIRNVMFGRYLGTGSFTEEAKEMYRYINENISDDGRIFFFKPRVLLLTTKSAAVYSLPQPGQAVDTSNFDFYLHTLDHGYGQLISDDEAKQETILLGKEEFTCIHGNGKMRLFARKH